MLAVKKGVVMKLIPVMLSLPWILAVGTSWSAEIDMLPYAISDSEMKRLPPYCFARMSTPMGSPEYNAWRDRIGQNFGDFYHYCHGLNFINRYWGARTAKERGFYLQQAMAEFNYMVNGEKPDFTMRADLYANRGEVLKLMGKTGEAIRDFNTAINADTKNARVYLQLADVYLNAKDKGRALETITQGLRYNPESKSLRRRYLELGGKEPFPEPVPEARAEPAAVTPPEAALPEPKPAPAKATNMYGVEASSPQSVAGEAAAKPDSPVPIGNSKNPYCRFCPPE
jgi:tetratricopeptide (TPR) repeat protein